MSTVSPKFPSPRAGGRNMKRKVRSAVKGPGRWLLIAPGIVVVLWLLTLAWATHRLNQERRAWAAASEPLDALLARFPATRADDRTMRLEQLAALLGADLVPPGVQDRPRPAKDRAGAFDRVVPGLGNFLEAQMGRPDDRIDVPPPDVAEFLAGHADAIAAIARHLSAGPPPVWEGRIGFTAPIPSLVGIRRLQGLLVAQALVEGRNRNPVKAAATLEASWQLNAALWRRPELVTKVLAMSVTPLQAGAARKLELPVAAWIARFEALDPIRGWRDSLTNEAWGFDELTVGRRPFLATGTGVYDAVQWAVWRPFLMLSVAEYERAMVKAVKRLSDDDLCALNPATESAFNPRFPVWAPLAEIAWVNLGLPSWRVGRLRLDLELSALVLQVRESRRAAPDRQPPQETALLPSRACPGARWDSRPQPDGSVLISLDRELPVPEKANWWLPTRHVVGVHSARRN